MAKSQLDAAAAAIASAPRRAMVDRLALGPASMSQLADAAGVGLSTVDKHIHVLADAGLVSKTKSGRSTSIRLEPGGLDELFAWALGRRLLWTSLLDRFEQHGSAPATDHPREGP